MSSTEVTIQPMRVEVDDADLQDLRDRLGRTRWPEAETVEDWSQGVPLAYLREVCEYWATEYDWRRVEAKLNAFEQGIATIDGLDIHFLHARSPVEGARPLVMTHGWPGSIVEFLDVLGPLTDPAAHGGEEADAFEVVCPALPGYGFGAKPSSPGWNLERIAAAWVQLMGALGHERFAAQGGDWGAFMTLALAQTLPQHLDGIHLNLAVADPEKLMELGEPTEEENAQLGLFQRYLEQENGYSQEQSTRPQTLGYGLTDSPAGQCAWILEKFMVWTDCDGHPENAIDRDRLLDNATFYWLSASAASSARLYWESYKSVLASFGPVDVPTGYTLFPHDLFQFSERWLRTRHSDLRHYARVERGGHFAAMEQPETFVAEVREAFRKMPAGG